MMRVNIVAATVAVVVLASTTTTQTLAVMIVVVSLASGAATGQAPTTARKTTAAATSTPSRTPWGDPDLQGVWRYEAAIALERPREFNGRELLTDEEVAKREQSEKEQEAKRLAGVEGAEVGRRPVSESPIRGNEYNNFWQDNGRPRKV